MFEDRRGRIDRRALDTQNTTPISGCRRGRERRNILRQYHPQPWWLQTNYVDELQPPILDIRIRKKDNPTDPNPS